MLSCSGLAPMAQAVGPDTEGAIPGSNNGEGIGVLVSRTGGIWNTGTGFEALNHLTAGNQNTATGLRALSSDTNGGFNTGTGVFSLFSNTSGFFNSATGAYSLANNIIGNYNTANGYAALYRNTGEGNTATGFAALYRNTSSANTANGYQALYSNTGGTYNTANGFQALYNNTSGNYNTANGDVALAGNTTGSNNTALGVAAGTNLTTGSFNIDIGNNGVAGEGNTIRIGSNNHHTATYIAGIAGQTVGAGGSTCYVDNDGKLGVFLSARRYKENIQSMGDASKVLLSLKPVTFRYKPEFNKEGTPQFGLVAEEVAEVNRDLVTRDAKGEISTVRYEAVNAMLLNEFLKQHHKLQKQEAAITELKSTVAQQEKEFQATAAQQEKEIKSLTASLKEQAAQIQKVSAQLETSKPGPKLVSQP